MVVGGLGGKECFSLRAAGHSRPSIEISPGRNGYKRPGFFVWPYLKKILAPELDSPSGGPPAVLAGRPGNPLFLQGFLGCLDFRQLLQAPCLIAWAFFTCGSLLMSPVVSRPAARRAARRLSGIALLLRVTAHHAHL